MSLGQRGLPLPPFLCLPWISHPTPFLLLVSHLFQSNAISQWADCYLLPNQDGQFLHFSIVWWWTVFPSLPAVSTHPFFQWEFLKATRWRGRTVNKGTKGSENRRKHCQGRCFSRLHREDLTEKVTWAQLLKDPGTVSMDCYQGPDVGGSFIAECNGSKSWYKGLSFCGQMLSLFSFLRNLESRVKDLQDELKHLLISCNWWFTVPCLEGLSCKALFICCVTYKQIKSLKGSLINVLLTGVTACYCFIIFGADFCILFDMHAHLKCFKSLFVMQLMEVWHKFVYI